MKRNRWMVGIALFVAVAAVAAGAEKDGAGERGLRRKLEQIVIDRVEFEEASLPAVIDYLKERAKKLDPEGKGVNLLLLPPRNKEEKVPVITISLEEVPLGEVIRYVCLAVDYHYKVERHAVVIAPKSRALDPMETRTHPVSPSTIQSLEKERPRQ